jgi:acetone carboxylase gamma subunit
VTYPLRENLEVHALGDGQWIRCARCSHLLSRADQNWRAACKRRLLQATKAGPLMKILEGRYVFEKLYCPSCGILLNAEMVEEKNEA